jgi:signal transduction histidine kinase/ligand-binding sensor domain-containing protein
MISRVTLFRVLSLVWLTLALVPAFSSVRAAGVAGDYLVDVWTSENGLPDSSVTAITQTPDGYLWIGTYNGLVRFDGVRFTTFDPANTPALGHARVRKLFVDARGTLWINTYDGSLTTLRDGKFSLEQRNVRFSEGELTLVTSSTNEAIFLTGRGALFRKNLSAPSGEGWDELPLPGRSLVGAMCCADNKGVFWYRDGEKHLWRFMDDRFEPVPDDAGLGGQIINYLTTDARGRLWVGTDQGIWVWRLNNFHLVLPVKPGKAGGVTFLYIADDGRIWAVVNGAVVAAQDDHWLLEPDSSGNFSLGNPTGLGAQADHRGGAWFYSYGRGLLHVGSDGQARQLTIEDGFPGERVYCFFEDHEGNWWAGLDAGGLVRVRERQFHAIVADGKILTKAAKSVAEDRSDTVWIGMLSGGLGRWQSSEYTNIPVTEGAGGGSVFCVCPDADGRLWLSAGDEDLYLREGGEIRRWQPVVHGVKAILRDHLGRVWLGTTSGLLCSETGEPGDLQNFKGISRRYIRALAEDKAGAIWAGTGNGEIYQIVSNAATLFRPEDKQGSGAIWSLLADDDGTVWAGTFRGGLLHWHDGKFTRYGKKDGLPDTVICQILDDGRGNLWIGSHQGVFRVAKSALKDFTRGKTRFIPCTDYARADGLPSLECSGGYQPSAWRDHEGRLWFTTAKGATWIQPAEIKPNLTPPPVVIEEVLVDGLSQNFAPDVRAEVLRIPPGKHQIEFRFTGLSLASPDRVQFRYRLAGVDSDWVLAGTRRSAQYGFLPPGEYDFHVIACNSDGVWNNSGASLKIEILPHFYETWWFQSLVVMLILGTVAGIVRHTATRRLHQRMEELERKQMVERERTRIAKDIHDDLGASLTLIAVLGDLAKKERAGERVEKMSSTAREAVKSLDEIVWAVNPRNDTLAHLIDYTGQFATDYLRDAGIRCLLDVPEHAPAREVPANVRHNVFLVVKEALQNIVKHARATEVWLRISTSERGLRIQVEDNGCGFDRPPEDAWADGLRNMRQRLAEISGECKIESHVGSGTTIAMELPLPTA